MNYATLKNCIATLERVRHAYSSQLDAGVLEEIDQVISELKKLADDANSDVSLGILSLRALELINLVIGLVSNITDLMK